MKGFRSFYHKSKADNFTPHRFESKLEMIAGDNPKILISKLAYNKMWHYVDLADQEVGWLGTVNKLGKAFLIKDVFLLKQEVSAAQTVITIEGLSEFGEDILKLPDGIEIYNNIRFWGHSHVNMGTSASGQDESQMDLFEESGHPYFIRGILNKRGRMEFTIYFYENGLRAVDPEWCVYDPVDSTIRNVIEKEFNDKVTKEKFNFSVYSYGKGKKRNNIYKPKNRRAGFNVNNGLAKTNRPIQT